MDPKTNPLYIAALAAARHDLRRQVREDRENDGAEIRHMLKNAGINTPAPWCAAFIQDITDSAAAAVGVTNPLDAVKLEAYVQSYADWATENKRRVLTVPVMAGDLVLFNFGGSRYDHIGIVVTPPRGDAPTAGERFWTIEGNTNEAGGREGDCVALKQRTIQAGRTLFVRWT